MSFVVKTALAISLLSRYVSVNPEFPPKPKPLPKIPAIIKRDIFNTNQNVSTTGCQTQRDILETKYNLGTQVLENRFNCSQNACATQKEILQNRYDNALQTQTLSSQIAQCCLMKIEATIREILCRFKNLIFGELLGI